MRSFMKVKVEVFPTEDQLIGKPKANAYFWRLYNLARRLSKCLILEMLLHGFQRGNLWSKKYRNACILHLNSSQQKVGIYPITWKMFSNHRMHRFSTTPWGMGVEKDKNVVWKKFPGHSGIYSPGRKPLLDLASNTQIKKPEKYWNKTCFILLNPVFSKFDHTALFVFLLLWVSINISHNNNIPQNRIWEMLN